MAIPDVVGVAVISGLFTAGGVLINWLLQRDVRALTSSHEKELAEMRARFDREGATHAATLRVRAEIRLRMFERSLQAVEQALQAAQNIFVAGAEEKPTSDETTMAIRMIDRVVRVSRFGLFLPPQLDEAFEEFLGEVTRAASDWADQRRKEGEWSTGIGRAARRCSEAQSVLTKRAMEWKRSAWATEFDLPEERR